MYHAENGPIKQGSLKDHFVLVFPKLLIMFSMELILLVEVPRQGFAEGGMALLQDAFVNEAQDCDVTSQDRRSEIEH